MPVRSYDSTSDADSLWRLKRAFERGLGSETGDETKATAYAEKLTEEYREGYLEWVDQCIRHDERCVQVATTSQGNDTESIGYAFLLPDSLAYVWDAAVLNEIYVRPEYRGTGLADDLMNAVLTVARDQDLPLDRIVLDVDSGNERARSFYDRYGFDHWGEMVARDL